MARRKSGEIMAALMSNLEGLEVEAARLLVLAKANGADRVLTDSASRVYKTVVAMAQDLKRLDQIGSS